MSTSRAPLGAVYSGGVSGPLRASRLSPWGRVVAVSALLVVGSALALAGWALASSEERVVTYAVRGAPSRIVLDVRDADVVVTGGGQGAPVRVQRTDRFAFGHDAEVGRSVTDGTLRLASRCPTTVLHACSVDFRIVVPDNVPVDVRTGEGDVRMVSYRGSARVTTDSGDVDVDAFCGFSLRAAAVSGDVEADASCAPQQLSLRSTSGSVHALVPPGRYEIDAQSTSGSRVVRGVATVADAPFSLQALSTSGDVLVERRP